MQKLDLKQDYQAKLPKTGFDMSQVFEFTSSTGMILPVYHDLLNPGERVRVAVDEFTRLQPVATAAMCDIDLHIDTFFVPLTMIYTPFQNEFFKTPDFVSSHFQVGGNPSFVPLLDYKNEDYLYNFIANPSADPYSLGEAARPARFESIGKGAFRLLMHLGLDPRSLKYPALNQGQIEYLHFPYDHKEIRVSPWFLCAYQAIYQHHYRDDDRELLDVGSYNIDRCFQSETISQLYGQKLHLLRFHLKPKDYFKSAHPSPIMSAVNSIDIGGSSIRGFLESTDSWLSQDNLLPVDTFGNEAPVGKTTQIALDGSLLSTGNIRNLFAVEKLLRVMGRASKNYDSQVLAHFGFKVPHDVKHQLSFLGSFHGSVRINPVLSTANTSDYDNGIGSPLGEIAGNGTSNIGGNPIEFTAPCHGVLMLCQHAEVRPSYPLGSVVNRLNMLTDLTDFYIPEYDRLGVQPLFAYESVTGDDILDSRFYSVITGWKYRYEQFKRKYNVHSIAFQNPDNHSVPMRVNQYASWIIADKPLPNVELSSGFVPLCNFVQAPGDINQIMVVPYSPVLRADYSATPWLWFQTDPFIHKLQVKCFKTSTMSTYGEPELD